MRARLKSIIKLLCLLISRIFRFLGFPAFQARDGFTSRRVLLSDLLTRGSVLEIGPFDRPTVRGPHVKYFDVIDQAGLVARARACGRVAEGCPYIDYVSGTGDLSIITDEKFDNVVSSHTLEHQPNLIRHLNLVSDILQPGGRYYVIVPDKRFTFDHSIPLTRVSDVLAADAEKREVHTLTSIFYHFAETTHSNAIRHWFGFHRSNGRFPPYVERLGNALEVTRQNEGDYIDVHCWCFTPPSFLKILETLSQMKLIRLQIERVYGTFLGTSEFFAVLRKSGTAG